MGKNNGREHLIRRTHGDLSTFLFGRVPPQARDLEEAVLGALMMEDDAYEPISRLLVADAFYVESHQRIFATIVRLKEKALPVDILTVTEELRHSGELEQVGGAYFITELTNRVASAANIESHALLIYQKYIQREIIRIGCEAVKDAFEDTSDVFDLRDHILAQMEATMAPVIASRETPLKKQLANMVARIAEAKERPDQHILGAGSGFRSLDAITNGFVTGDVNVIAARSGMGKTSLALCIAKNMAAADLSVDVYSLETADIALLMKWASADIGMPYTNIQHGEVALEAINDFAERFAKLPITIQDTTNVYIEDLVARARLRRRRYGVKRIIIDYLQLCMVRSLNRNANREQEIAHISRSLKRLAKDEDISVIVLAQLLRSIDARADKRPMLSDLRESGAIETDADKVIFLWRPAHYKIDYDEKGYSTEGIANLDIAKHRNGATGITKLQWHPATTKFTEFPAGWQPRFEPTAVLKKKKSWFKLRDHTEPNKEEVPEPPDDLPF